MDARVSFCEIEIGEVRPDNFERRRLSAIS
jgi:hypothetical protein